MKKLCLLVIFGMMIFGNGKGQNLIAVQNGGEPRFFTNLTDAITNAQAKDTIYIPGNIFPIDININKELHIIGVGHHPDSTIVTGYTRLNGGFRLGNGSSNGSIEGIYLSGEISFNHLNGPTQVTGFSIIRNNINSIGFQTDNTPARYTKNSIIENIIRGSISYSGGTFPSDIQSNFILNNIIFGAVLGLHQNNLIKNNVFVEGGAKIIGSNGCQFESNIILENSGGDYSISNCSFKNNLFMVDPNYNINQNGTNVFNNNLIVLREPIFITYPSQESSFNYAVDYHLKPDCLGKNAGRDGTDIGIYGGAFPWKDGSIPSNPHFQKAKISPTTDTNGNLNVKIKVAAQDH